MNKMHLHFHCRFVLCNELKILFPRKWKKNADFLNEKSYLCYMVCMLSRGTFSSQFSDIVIFWSLGNGTLTKLCQTVVYAQPHDRIGKKKSQILASNWTIFFVVYDTQHKLMFSPKSALIAVGIRFGCWTPFFILL